MIHIKRFNPLVALNRIFSEQNLSFLRENSKLFTQFIITLLSIGIGIWFIKNERGEITKVTEGLGSKEWVALGSVLFLILFFYSVYRSLLNRGIVFRLTVKYFPSFEVLLAEN